MQVSAFPGCCTAVVLRDFGGTVTSSGRWVLVPRAKLIKEMKNATGGYAFRTTYGIVSVSTNSEQKEANKLLRDLGFRGSAWISKGQHKNTKVKVWWIESRKLLKALDTIT